MKRWLLLGVLSVLVGSTVGAATSAIAATGAGSPHGRRPIFSDSFGRADGALGLPWTATASTWGVRSGRAQLLSGTYASTTATATVNVGTTNVTVAADITLSSTPRRANAGITPGFVDYRNNLYCKIEVSPVNPNGLMSIGRRLNGTTTSRLVYAGNTGFVNGGTYHVVCVRSGSTVRMTVGARTIAYTLTSSDLAVFGATTKVGLRSHMAADEDDGGSRYDNFQVTSP
jgi:hypothetical protein